VHLGFCEVAIVEDGSTAAFRHTTSVPSVLLTVLARRLDGAPQAIAKLRSERPMMCTRLCIVLT
jgi:hypothetical protein